MILTDDQKLKIKEFCKTKYEYEFCTLELSDNTLMLARSEQNHLVASLYSGDLEHLARAFSGKINDDTLSAILDWIDSQEL